MYAPFLLLCSHSSLPSFLYRSFQDGNSYPLADFLLFDSLSLSLSPPRFLSLPSPQPNYVGMYLLGPRAENALFHIVIT